MNEENYMAAACGEKETENESVSFSEIWYS